MLRPHLRSPAFVRLIHCSLFPSGIYFFPGAYSVYQKCKSLFHPGFLQANFLSLSDNSLPSPCSNVVFRIVVMDPKLHSSKSATGLINLEKALKHCHSFLLLSIREAVRNKLRASLLFPSSSRSI